MKNIKNINNLKLNNFSENESLTISNYIKSEKYIQGQEIKKKIQKQNIFIYYLKEVLREKEKD